MAVPGATLTDAERIEGQLFDQLRDYRYPKGIKYVQRFNAEAIAWAKLQAQLSVMLTEVLPQVIAILSADGVLFNDTARICALVLNRLPKYKGEVDSTAIVAWATGEAIDIARKTVGVWQRYAKVERAVYGSINKILDQCRDLETRIGLQIVANNLAFDVMLYFIYNSHEFTTDDTILARQLAHRGELAAHAWKKATLARVRKWEIGKPVESLVPEQAQVFQMKVKAGRDQVISKGRPIRLGPNDIGQREVYGKRTLRLEAHDVPLGYLEPHWVSTEMKIAA